MKSLSIIIPVYNVEAYIARCLESVLSQADETMEVICVNDGSTDNSRHIISIYLQRYSNIRCIDRPNGGLSAARNTGIAAAQGEYIIFLDSDDWLEINVLRPLYNQAKQDELDVLIGNTQWIYKDQIKKNKNVADVIKSPLSGVAAYITLMNQNAYIPMAYNQICRRQYILNNKLYFAANLIYEDELWTPQVLIKSSKTGTSSLYHYNYFQRENTIINSSLNEHKINSLFVVVKKLLIFAQSLGINNQELYNYLFLYIANLYQTACQRQEEGGFKKSQIINPNQMIWAMVQKKIDSNYFSDCISCLFKNAYLKRALRSLYRFYIKSLHK